MIGCYHFYTQMHEIGHNLGFDHSGVEGDDYGDRVGVMGSSSGPTQDRMCFNPHKNFFLPWYTDQNNSTDPLDGDGTRDFLLNGVANYGDDPLATISLRLQTPSSPYDYFVGFNRKSGVNAGSLTEPNMVTVVRAEKDSIRNSIKIASLVPGSAYEIEDFDGIGNSATVLFLALTDGKDAIVRIFDGPLPPANDFDNCTTNVADLIPLTVLINMDKYPDDVSWSIRDAVTGVGVGSGGNYPATPFRSYEETVCISKSSIDKIYTFIINDMYDDGLCCMFGSSDPTIKPGFKVTNAKTVYVDKLGVELEYGNPNPESKKDPFTYNITIAGAPIEAPTEAPTQNPTEAPAQNPTEAPTKDPTEAPTKNPTEAPTKEPTVIPSVIQSKTCSVLSKNKCKKRKEDCLFSKKKKNEKPCSIRKDKYNHECKQYEDKKACIAVQYCSYSQKTCSHKCDTTKRKCKKEREGIDGPKICNYEKYQPCANNCCGCCKL